ncbi:unnamed protein product [Arabidopsis halleri]
MLLMAPLIHMSMVEDGQTWIIIITTHLRLATSCIDQSLCLVWKVVKKKKNVVSMLIWNIDVGFLSSLCTVKITSTVIAVLSGSMANRTIVIVLVETLVLLLSYV